MQDWIKEHDREIWLTHSQTSTVSEHDHNTGHQPLWNEIKFIDRVPHYYTPKVKGAIHIRLRSDNINRDGGVEIPEAWMPTIPRSCKTDRRGTNQPNGEEMPQENMFGIIRYPSISCSMTSSCKLALQGYEPKELTGYGIFWPKINGIQDTQTPLNGASQTAAATLRLPTILKRTSQGTFP